MNKDNNIEVPVNTFEDLLWSAIRYCIGRHSYVSTFAEEFWQIISKNIDNFSTERLHQLAKYIRGEISNCIGFYNNILITNAFNDRIVYDAYSLLAKYNREHPEVSFENTFFEINCITGEVNTSSYEGEYPFTLDKETDMVSWIHFADCLDSQKQVELIDGDVVTCIYDCVKDAMLYIKNWKLYLTKDEIKQIIQ